MGKTLFLGMGVAAMMLPVGAAAFDLNSSDIQAGKPIQEKNIYNGFGCKGSNISPALAWHNAPAGTKSFALMVHDPDAPTGGAGFWHWVVVDIPASATSLSAGAGTADGKGLPQGAKQIKTDFGAPGYGGPCPPVGDKPHRYNFILYALKTEKLELPANATASLGGFMINMNAIGKAMLTGKYGR